MTSENQSSLERFYLDKFLDVLGLKPESVERGADLPDFVIVLSQKQVAVELTETEFHSGATGASGKPRRAVEEEWRNIQKVFQQERRRYPGLDEVSGLLFFKELQVPPKSRHGQFLKELLDFAQSKRTCLSKEGCDFSCFGSGFPLLGGYLTRLHLCDAGCYIT